MPPDGPDRDDDDEPNSSGNQQAQANANALNHYNSNVPINYMVQVPIAGYTSNNNRTRVQVSNETTQTPTQTPTQISTQTPTQSYIGLQNAASIASLKKQIDCMKSMLMVLSSQIETCEIEINRLS